MTTEPNDLAYPMYANLPQNIHSRGLTKRELFALEIFSGLIAVPETNPNALISTSVDLADKLIEQLNKTETITPRPPLESSGY
ncbi:MAG: hypothetical protein AN482_09480 [Anabaena sp. LE011-02]|nr:MAG: hypothetical protein AN482_09480 [Anabaena sp. LE011-02]